MGQFEIVRPELVTPAMKSGIANHPWTIEELVGLLNTQE
jgi:hypothetical protein